MGDRMDTSDTGSESIDEIMNNPDRLNRILKLGDEVAVLHASWQTGSHDQMQLDLMKQHLPNVRFLCPKDSDRRDVKALLREFQPVLVIIEAPNDGA